MDMRNGSRQDLRSTNLPCKIRNSRRTQLLRRLSRGVTIRALRCQLNVLWAKSTKPGYYNLQGEFFHHKTEPKATEFIDLPKFLDGKLRINAIY